MCVPFSVILGENCLEYIQRCIMSPRIRSSINTLHEIMTNELGKFEEGKGCVVVLPVVRKVVHSLPLVTLCPFNDPRQTLY